MKRFAQSVVLLSLLVAAISAAPPPPPPGPTLFLPPRPDTSITTAPPAPLIVPGQTPASGEKTAEQRAQEYLQMGQTLEAQNNAISAIAAYRNALNLDTTLVGVASHMGDLFVRLGDDRTAVQMFATEVTRHPGDASAARAMGLALARLGEHSDAIAQLEFLTRRRPGDADSWGALGFAYLAVGRIADAQTALRRAITLAPNRSSLHRDLGVVLSAQNRNNEARAEYRRAIALDRSDASLWVNLGNLERRAGRPDSALAAYRRASRMDTMLVAALQGEAQTLIELGRDNEAGPVYLRWTRLNPGDFGARLEAFQFFMGEGRPDIALELGRDAVRRERRSSDAFVLLGVGLDATGSKRDALAALRTAESLSPTEAGKARPRQLIAALRASAPDSLRGLFTADSLAHVDPAAGSAPR